MPHPMALGRISPERFKRVSRNCTHLSGTVSQIHVLDMTWPAASGRLQTAVEYCVKCVKQYQPATSRIIWLLFSTESSNFVRTSRLSQSTATMDMTSSATLPSAFIEVRKQPLVAVGRILAVWRFACPTNWWVSCFT